jgi:hypothetical protein
LLNAASLLRQDGDSAGALRLYRQAMETEATLMPSVGGGEGEGEEGGAEEEEEEGEEEEGEEEEGKEEEGEEEEGEEEEGEEEEAHEAEEEQAVEQLRWWYAWEEIRQEASAKVSKGGLTASHTRARQGAKAPRAAGAVRDPH